MMCSELYAIYKSYSEEDGNGYCSIEDLINFSSSISFMPTVNYVLGNLEEAVRKESELYRAALQAGLRKAINREFWDEKTTKVEPLRSADTKGLLADYFFSVRDEYISLQAGYILPFKKIAVADRSPFVEAFAQVLLPQGYEVLRYAHHRGMPDIRYLVELLRHPTSSNLQVVRSTEQQHFLQR